jgi:hypothetical protein
MWSSTVAMTRLATRMDAPDDVTDRGVAHDGRCLPGATWDGSAELGEPDTRGGENYEPEERDPAEDVTDAVGVRRHR